jgi:hypothetical protein
MMLRELRNGTSRHWSSGVDLQINGVGKQYNDNEITMEIVERQRQQHCLLLVWWAFVLWSKICSNEFKRGDNQKT